ncbi:hypothetical protein VCUG_00168 [Vavraia culicis subsp. floridensis]|uniref:SUN domain-containing protein n=1 Tax=Vavraia culicis (isolate floridensis) TaxID=948595 RepID=L2GYA9_VAVCU|nr:uncharacterized protein VCUG_00168 [Vavraia culicis subsp. floridensis]ELA48332.1 hypothetical protein VCUG_00168 [Vavraia culicis subsp. floridensis]
MIVKVILFLFSLTECTRGCNYASSLCGAFIVYTSKNLDRPDAILTPNSDHYAIGECAPTYIIVKLCNEVKINCVELQNKEYLSSFPRQIKLSTYIDGSWVSLGSFSCRFTRGQQLFYVKNDVFTSILRIDVLNFQGKHSLFTLTSLKVYGSTILENLNVNNLTYSRAINFNNKLPHYENKNDIEDIMRSIRVVKMLMEKSKIIFAGILGFLSLVVFYFVFRKSLQR